MAGNIENAERFEGVWNGENVSPKRVWSGHRFTDAEIQDLLAGKEITITALSSRTGKEFKCTGKLSKQLFNGNEFVGFERTGFVNDGPTSWCRHNFTEDEKKALLAGETVKASDFIGKSGRKFKAEIKWDSAAGKIEIVEFLK